jgi:hypothetical protein
MENKETVTELFRAGAHSVGELANRCARQEQEIAEQTARIRELEEVRDELADMIVAGGWQAPPPDAPVVPQGPVAFGACMAGESGRAVAPSLAAASANSFGGAVNAQAAIARGAAAGKLVGQTNVGQAAQALGGAPAPVCAGRFAPIQECPACWPPMPEPLRYNPDCTETVWLVGGPSSRPCVNDTRPPQKLAPPIGCDDSPTRVIVNVRVEKSNGDDAHIGRTFGLNYITDADMVQIARDAIGAAK